MHSVDHIETHLKVLMLSLDLPPRAIGGIGRHVQDLLDELDAHGIAVTLVVPQKPGNTIHRHYVHSRIIEVPCNPTPMETASPAEQMLWELISVIESNIPLATTLGRLAQEHFDILHFHDIFTAASAIALANLMDVPLIITKHFTPSLQVEVAPEDNVHVFSQHFLVNAVQAFEKHMFRHAAGIIGVSHDSINYIRTLIDGRMPLMRWIPNGTDFEKFADRQVYGQLKRASICTPDERLILLPGILEFRKGGRVLLEALHILGRANLHVAFLGDGPAKDLLRDIAFTLHLDTQVHFLGHAEDPEIADWYLAADLIVLPSFREALPYVLLEAMVLGKPVLATPAGGVAELVENGVNGLLVPVGDVQALADGICRLVDDPDYAAALAQNGAREVRERWSRASMARETIDFYHHIILQSR